MTLTCMTTLPAAIGTMNRPTKATPTTFLWPALDLIPQQPQFRWVKIRFIVIRSPFYYLNSNNYHGTCVQFHMEIEVINIKQRVMLQSSVWWTHDIAGESLSQSALHRFIYTLHVATFLVSNWTSASIAAAFHHPILDHIPVLVQRKRNTLGINLIFSAVTRGPSCNMCTQSVSIHRVRQQSLIRVCR